MKLFHQIAALMIVAAAVPLATAGFEVVHLNEAALTAEVRARFDATARHAAEAVSSGVEGKARLIASTAQMIRWGELDEAEARAALSLLAHEVNGRAALIAEKGPRGTVAWWAEAGANTNELSRRAPIEAALGETRGAVVLSPVYAIDREPWVAAAIPVAGGPLSQVTRALAVEIPLGFVASALDAVRGGGELRLLIVESDGHVVADSPRALKPASDATAAAAVRDFVANGAPGARLYPGDSGTGGEPLFGTHAAVGELGWAVVADEDAARALATPRRLRRVTLEVCAGATLGALAVAFLFARRLSGALERLTAAARAVAEGDLRHRVGHVGSGEVADLSSAFDTMSAHLLASREEIEHWNRELEARVEARGEELRSAQVQLVEAQKLAALGQMGAGIAHEIKNPLAAVLAQVQLLLLKKPEPDADRNALSVIEEQARRASQVVENLLRFSEQRRPTAFSPVDLNRVVRETVSLTESIIHAQGVALVLVLDPEVPRVQGDAGQLSQVLLNLVQNARTATPRGGRITIRTVSGPGAEKATIVVEDSGRGIAPEHRPHIFEPFYTTKDEWSNVGLGLSVSFRIASEHGGQITFDSDVGAGSTFRLHLPAEG